MILELDLCEFAPEPNAGKLPGWEGGMLSQKAYNPAHPVVTSQVAMWHYTVLCKNICSHHVWSGISFCSAATLVYCLRGMLKSLAVSCPTLSVQERTEIFIFWKMPLYHAPLTKSLCGDTLVFVENKWCKNSMSRGLSHVWDTVTFLGHKTRPGDSKAEE